MEEEPDVDLGEFDAPTDPKELIFLPAIPTRQLFTSPKTKKKKGKERDVVYDIEALETLPSGSNVYFDGNYKRDLNLYVEIFDQLGVDNEDDKKIIDAWKRVKLSEDLKDKSPAERGKVLAEEHKEAVLKAIENNPIEHRDIQYFKIWEHDFKLEEEKFLSNWKSILEKSKSEIQGKDQDGQKSGVQREKHAAEKIEKKTGDVVKAKMTTSDLKKGEKKKESSKLKKGKKSKDSSKTKKSESKEKAKEEIKPESKEKAKEEIKPESKEKAKEEVKPESKEKAKEEVKPESKEKAKEEVKSESKEKAKEEVKSESKEKAKPKVKKKSKSPGAKSKVKKKSKSPGAEARDSKSPTKGTSKKPSKSTKKMKEKKRYIEPVAEEYMDYDALMKLGIKMKEAEAKRRRERLENRKKRPKTPRQIRREEAEKRKQKEEEEIEKKEIEMIEEAERDSIRQDEKEYLAYHAQDNRNVFDESLEDQHIILVTDDEIKNMTVKAPRAMRNAEDEIEIIDDPKYLEKYFPELLKEPKPSRFSTLAKPLIAVYNPCIRATRYVTRPMRRLLRPVVNLAAKPFIREHHTDTEDEEFEEWLDGPEELEPGTLQNPISKLGAEQMTKINEEARIRPKITEVIDLEQAREVKPPVKLKEITFHNKQQIDYVLEITKKNVWYYRDRMNVARGPCTMPVLREAWINGVVDENTLAWGHGFMDWLPIKNIRTLIMQIRTPEVRFVTWFKREFSLKPAMERMRKKRWKERKYLHSQVNDMY